MTSIDPTKADIDAISRWRTGGWTGSRKRAAELALFTALLATHVVGIFAPRMHGAIQRRRGAIGALNGANPRTDVSAPVLVGLLARPRSSTPTERYLPRSGAER